MKLVLVMIAPVTILVGCHGNGGDHAAPGSPTPPSVGVKPTLPEYFPDLVAYPEADHQVFEMTEPQAQGFAFTTRDGLTCSNNAYPEPEWEVLKCFGSRPDQGPGVWTVEVQARGNVPATSAASDEPAMIEPFEVKDQGAKPPPALMSARHTVSYEGILCGVDVGLTACRIGDHGFVLTETETKLF